MRNLASPIKVTPTEVEGNGGKDVEIIWTHEGTNNRSFKGSIFRSI
jgi:hypothetical protein